MKRFLEHIGKSIYAPAYYRELIGRPASYSWKYYASLALLLAVLATIVASIPLVPKVNAFLYALPEKAVAAFPEDLAIVIKDGVASTSVAEPYFVKFSSAEEGGEVRVLVIDRTSPISRDTFERYGAFMWLTRDSLIVEGSSGELRVVPLAKELALTIDRPHVRTALSDMVPYFAFVPPLVVFAIFIGLVLSYVAMLAYLLLAALLVLLLGKLMKEGWSYSTSYRIALHAVTLPMLVSFLSFILPSSSAELPFLSTALLLAVVFVNFKDKVALTEGFDKEG